ncbi:MAG: DNA-processing protein DprA, partial [Atopostipes suicloacalis]|nr:DNA-processing protein DprA [Atopostipes suicloacalis]
SMIESKNIKKLSNKKKASFACFLKEVDIQEEMEKYQSKNISWKYIYSKDYPNSLRQIYMPPILIFYQGDYSILENHLLLAVVGARSATDYGLKLVSQLIPGLVKQSNAKIAIVSGLAKGIDSKAHEECINSEGRTIGIIGSGLDCYYPRENQHLQRKIMKEELVLSEYPLSSKPQRFHFPERNRIIAGLSRGVLVIEAKERSGSLITAYNAFDENRDLFACPGSLLTKTSDGCHKLIQSGAFLTRKSEDILKEWFII